MIGTSAPREKSAAFMEAHFSAVSDHEAIDLRRQTNAIFAIRKTTGMMKSTEARSVFSHNQIDRITFELAQRASRRGHATRSQLSSRPALGRA